MAKKLMTKPQIVSHFAEKFEFSKKMASGVIEEVEALAISKTKNPPSFYPSSYWETGPNETLLAY
jgi:hypothetical protein